MGQERCSSPRQEDPHEGSSQCLCITGAICSWKTAAVEVIQGLSPLYLVFEGDAASSVTINDNLPYRIAQGRQEQEKLLRKVIWHCIRDKIVEQ